MPATAEQKLWMYESMALIWAREGRLAIACFEGKMPPDIQNWRR